MKVCFLILFFVFILEYGICEHGTLNIDLSPNIASLKNNTEPTDIIIIPVMVHFDNALPISLIDESKNPNKLREIATNILKDVEITYRYPSLNQTIQFELIDAKILMNNTKRKIMDANVSRYLKAFCQWQGEKKTIKQWWYSVLITGLDLYYVDKNGQPVMSSSGRGYRRGICSNNHSCTVLEWHPDTMGYVLAHEIAHSLGISHDGAPHNECTDKRYIMDTVYDPMNPVKIWSPCNQRDLKEFLKSKYAWCL